MQSSPNHHALLSLIYAFHSCLNKVILIFSRHTVSFHMLSKILQITAVYARWLESNHSTCFHWNRFHWTHFYWTRFHCTSLNQFFVGPVFGTIFDRISSSLSIQYLVMFDHYDDSNYSCDSTKAGFHLAIFRHFQRGYA